jgi:hypothetical protein
MYWFTWTKPAGMRWTRSIARARSRVQIAAASPNWVPFAWAQHVLVVAPSGRHGDRPEDLVLTHRRIVRGPSINVGS